VSGHFAIGEPKQKKLPEGIRVADKGTQYFLFDFDSHLLGDVPEPGQ
jgi:hypothetical protein